MDVLKDKSMNSFDYVCRYSSVPFYYHTIDNKYIYGIGTQIEKENIQYVAHKVKDTDTLEYLALKYYNNPTFYWVIAYFNDVLDCYSPLIDNFSIIKIPNISSLAFGAER